jgi:hypothetical protein
MGQNNDLTEHGDLQGNQGGNLSKDPKQHERLCQPEEGFARVQRDDAHLISQDGQESARPASRK